MNNKIESLKIIQKELMKFAKKIEELNIDIKNEIKSKKEFVFADMMDDIRIYVDMAKEANIDITVNTGIDNIGLIFSKRGSVFIARLYDNDNYFIYGCITDFKTFDEVKQKNRYLPSDKQLVTMIETLMKNWDIASKQVIEEFSKKYKVELQKLISNMKNQYEYLANELLSLKK